MIRLDLGAGDVSPRGFVPMGHAHGSSIYPLPHADGSVDTIRASHVLEHFPHAEIPAVLADWARALKPGGTLRIAVPDFAHVASNYLSGVAQPTESFIMGAQASPDDFHKALFDEPTLRRMLAEAGLMLVRRWTSELNDCAALPISLNLEATKPHIPEIGVSGVMSVPRLGFMDNMFSAIEALPSLKVPLRRFTGAFWGQCLERVIEETLREDKPNAVLTLDYDSVFTRRDASMLMQLMCCYPEADAIAAVQAGRGSIGGRLFTMRDAAGNGLTQVPGDTFAGDLTPVHTAHFGLTLIRADKLARMRKPWFRDEPAPDGSWNDGRVDADIAFWNAWAAAGNSLFLANRVAIGHLELNVLWPSQPGRNTAPVVQAVGDWRSQGKPAAAWQ